MVSSRVARSLVTALCTNASVTGDRSIRIVARAAYKSCMKAATTGAPVKATANAARTSHFHRRHDATVRSTSGSVLRGVLIAPGSLRDAALRHDDDVAGLQRVVVHAAAVDDAVVVDRNAPRDA